MSVQGEKRREGTAAQHTHAGLLAVHSEGTEGLWGNMKLPWGTGIKEQLSLPTSEVCSFPTHGQLLAMLLQDTLLR